MFMFSSCQEYHSLHEWTVENDCLDLVIINLRQKSTSNG